MSDEIKLQIITAWNRYADEQSKRYRKNEGSTTQHEDYCRLFKKGIVDHPKLSKKEKEELLVKIGFVSQPA
jgi:hypothetical protein